MRLLEQNLTFKWFVQLFRLKLFKLSFTGYKLEGHGLKIHQLANSPQSLGYYWYWGPNLSMKTMKDNRSIQSIHISECYHGFGNDWILLFNLLKTCIATDCFWPLWGIAHGWWQLIDKIWYKVSEFMLI